jgi:hypothetical protein
MPTQTATRLKRTSGRVNVIYRDAKGKTRAGVPLAVSAPAKGTGSIPTGLVATPGAAGTLNNGTYGYRVSAVVGGESLACATVTAVTVAGPGAGSVGLSWNAVTGATNYKIYGRTSGSELLMATQTGTTFTDNGSVTPSGALPTLATNTATVTTRASNFSPKSGTTGVTQAVAMRGSTARYFLRYGSPAGYPAPQRS